MKKLTVPVKIPLRWEAWHGFGRSELLRTLAVCLPVTAIALILCLSLGSRWTAMNTAMAAVFSFSAAAMAFQRMDNNISAYDYLRRMVAFQRSQKIYYYKRKESAIRAVSEEEG